MRTTVPAKRGAVSKDGDSEVQIGTPYLQDVDDAAARIGHTFPGRIPAIAQRMGVNASTLNKKLDPNCESHRLSVAEAVHLQFVTGRADVLYSMAATLSHVCLPMPDHSTDQVALTLAQIGAEVGDLFREAQAALQDGKITANERKRISDEAASVMAALAAFLRVI